MRFSLPFLRRMAEALRTRDWFGIGFELFVVVLGVMLGMAASRWAAEREERQYRSQMIAALDEVLVDYVESGHRIHGRIVNAIADHERRVSAGDRPPPPVLRFPRLDRPPTRGWDAMIATGLANSVEPKLVFRLAMHFSRADSFGDRYERYNQFTEQQILPFQDDPAHFYGPGGALKRPYAQHVDRLREILALNDEMTAEAASIRRDLRAPS